MDIEKLRAKLKEKEITDAQYANALGINISTLYRMYKKGGAKMSVGQMHLTVDFLPLTTEEAIDIFFFLYLHFCK